MNMTSVFLILLAAVWNLTAAQNLEFNCKPRKGCFLPRCDPSPLITPGVLKRNEYPITCVGTQPAGKSGSSQVSGQQYQTLLNLYGRQRRRVDSLSAGVASLNSKHQKLAQQSLQYQRRWNQTALSLSKLERRVAFTTREKNKLRIELNQLKRTKTISPSEGNSSAKVKDLEFSLGHIFRILGELQKKNSKLEKEIKELKASKEQTERPPTTARQTTLLPISTAQRTTRRWTPVPPTTSPRIPESTATIGKDSCESPYRGVCFFVITKSSRSLNFEKAKEECTKRNAFSALITTERMYKAATKIAKDQLNTIGDGEIGIKIVWTGMLYDTTTRRIIKPSSAYVKWAPGFPRQIRSSNSVVIRLSVDGSSLLEGMFNIDQFFRYDAVLCQRWID